MESEWQKMVSGELYDPADEELAQARRRARGLLRELNALKDEQEDERRGILASLFGKGGESARVQPPFYCDYGTNIEIGKHVFFNFNCVVLDVSRVSIGDYSIFAPAVQIYTATHPLDAEVRRTRAYGERGVSRSGGGAGGGATLLRGR